MALPTVTVRHPSAPDLLVIVSHPNTLLESWSELRQQICSHFGLHTATIFHLTDPNGRHLLASSAIPPGVYQLFLDTTISDFDTLSVAGYGGPMTSNRHALQIQCHACAKTDVVSGQVLVTNTVSVGVVDPRCTLRAFTVIFEDERSFKEVRSTVQNEGSTVAVTRTAGWGISGTASLSAPSPAASLGFSANYTQEQQSVEQLAGWRTTFVQESPHKCRYTIERVKHADNLFYIMSAAARGGITKDFAVSLHPWNPLVPAAPAAAAVAKASAPISAVPAAAAPIAVGAGPLNPVPNNQPLPAIPRTLIVRVTANFDHYATVSDLEKNKHGTPHSLRNDAVFQFYL